VAITNGHWAHKTQDNTINKIMNNTVVTMRHIVHSHL